jgi:hypothetical protein
LKTLYDYESSPHPSQRAADVLWARLPTFVLFEEHDRELRSVYDVDELRNGIPIALRNLGALANLDWNKFFDAIDSNDVGALATLEDGAAKTLEEQLKAWTQSGIVCRINGDPRGRQVRSAVGNPGSLWAVEARSAGLQWFVALVAFLHAQRVSNPVLLIDEAEQHLHYDAQADLVEMMTVQQRAARVIYTTHSAGCLPEDLASVRVLVMVDDLRSEVRNWFWESHEAGLSSLILEMGAARFAFVHSRHALICEGASDFLLLPAMLRECTGKRTLGYQVAPGLSEVDDLSLQRLDSEAGTVAYIVDRDSGGDELVRRLRSVGVQSKRVHRLPPGATTIEDLIALDVLVPAIEAVLEKNGSPAKLPPNLFRSKDRWDVLKSWCRKEKVSVPNKRQLAQAVLMSDGRPLTRPTAVNAMRKLEGELRVALSLLGP